MPITDILLLLILAVLVVAIVLCALYLRERDSVWAARFGVTSDKLVHLNGFQLEMIGVLRRLLAEMEDYRRDFALTLNTELANKVNSIISSGNKPADMMKKYNEETKKEEWVPIDHGW